MNAVEHYQEAQRLLAEAETLVPGGHPTYLVARAGVHAQLAGVAHAVAYTAVRASPVTAEWRDALTASAGVAS